jgi:MinD-like ATPase involved in chromosome partitioning or flagellar assembly/tetratricopeptide (TPR) repeat protein
VTTSDSHQHAGTAQGRGTIITFYSYKGGTGRTMALANVAWILASAGHKVLAVDWDLESPGLHRYFHPFLEDKKLRHSPGVIDMVRDYADVRMQPPAEGEDADWIGAHSDVLRYAVSLDWTFDGAHRNPAGRAEVANGYLDLLPAGRQDQAYHRTVSTFDWPAFYERLGGNAFLDALARSMRDNYDYVLLDSRTGVSDSAGICTIRLPDVVVTSFTMNDQSIDGAAAVARSISRQRVERPVRLLPVPMRVEDAEQLKLEAGRDHARRSFAPFLPRMAPAELDRYWGDVEIPYKPYYAYEEILAPFGDRPRQEGTLLAAYERLTRIITDGAVPELQPIDERRRRRWLLFFERTRATTADVFLSYAAVDRMWAEWISGELSDAGLRVTMREIDLAPEAVDGEDGGGVFRNASRVLILLSQDYVQSPNAAELWKQAVERDPGGAGRFLVPIRLDNVRTPPPFVERAPIDLAGITDEDRATELLLEALDQPHQPRSAASAPSDSRRRFPAIEPPLWSAPQRNATFTGRRALLEEIRNRLSATANVGTAQALHGLGGVGKTQTALEYAHRFRADYDIVWWMSAEQPSVARGALAMLAEQMGLSGGDSVDERVRAALSALRRGAPYRRWLLIFDNADDPGELRRFLPQGPGHVLITTRNQDWARDANLVEVGVFSRAESVTLIRRRVPHLSEFDADIVAGRLADLPLAIEQAGAWLAATGEPVSGYLERLDEQLPAMLTEELPPDYEQTGAQPWLVSLQSLRTRNPAAAKLLEVCAFFASEPIPMSLLYGDRFVSVVLPFDPSVRDPLLMGRTIREISRYALARIDTVRRPAGAALRRRLSDRADDGGQTSIQLHPLVQAVIRASLPAEEAAENRRHVHAILAAANPKDPDQPENWSTYADLWPHLLPSLTPASDQPEVRQLLLDVARYLWKVVDYTTCQELAEQTVQRWQQRFGEDDPQTLLMRFHLANALRLEARYQAAHEIDRDVHERLRRTLGEDHPYTLMAAGSLAGDLRALGDFSAARDLDVRTEAMARDVFGEDNHRALMAAHNLALSLRLVGDLRGALQLNEATFLRRRATQGETHPYTLYSAGQYGRDLRDTGDLRESRRVLEAAAEAHRQVLGEEHPETLRVLINFAVTLRKLGEFEPARKLSADTLEKARRLHGPDHPDVQACAMCLACDESALGQHESALLRARPVYEWYRTAMGEEHLFTLGYGNNLAIFLREAGDLAGASALTLEVVERFTATIGADHPYTLAARINLGNCLYAAGDYAAARANDEQEYERIRRLLGAEHPDTLAAANNLATSRSNDGDEPGARRLREEVLPIYRRVLGDNHPNTIALVAANRLNCDLEPPPT